MPEPILGAFFHLPRHISNSTMYIFSKTYDFLFTLQWSLIKTREPPPPAIEAFVGVGGSLVHCALSASVCLHLLTCVVFISSYLWSVMKFWIVWFLIVWFDQNLWLPDHKVAVKYSPNTVKLIQRYYQGRKYTLQSKD